jgi:WhiB family transcriptional regulator, redox-sensing transcriptional regulator
VASSPSESTSPCNTLDPCASLEDARPALIGLDPFLGRWPADLPCQVQDPRLWFAESPTQLEKAKDFCQTCPVRLVCLCGALTRQEPWGVWGGEIFERGVIVARKRPRGRPRKTDRTPDRQPSHREAADSVRRLAS